MRSKEIGALTADELRQHLLSLKEPAIMPHRNPDGDAIGSAVAAVRYLREEGIDAKLLSPDGIPARLAFLTEGVPLFEGEPREIVTVDVASLAQAGKGEALIEKAEVVYMIDHHALATPFAPHYIRPDAAAVGELLYDLFSKDGQVALSTELATPLYAAIASDTGNFRFRNVTAKTMRAAGELLETGIDASEISRRLFDLKTERELNAMAYAIMGTRTYYDGALAVLTISLDEIRQLGCDESDFDAVIDVVRTRVGVEVAAVIRERADGTVRLSVRTTGADAASLCASFGGGGHRVAAGCTLPCTNAEEGLDLFLVEANRLFKIDMDK